jgi:transcriptional activator SPT7
MEDEDLPLKQRFPKPRLGANGKITSPRKRPLKEQGPGKGHPRKKMKTNEGEAKETGKENGATKDGESLKANPEKALELTKLTNNSLATNVNGDASQDDLTVGTPTPRGEGKQRETNGGMISPESLEAT